MKGFDTDATLGTKYKNLSKHRYFVIEPSDKDSQKEFAYQFFISNKDLCIYIRNVDDDLNIKPLPYHTGKNSFSFSNEDIPRKSDEDILVYNRTTDAKVSFALFGWNKKEGKWDDMGTVTCSSDKGERIKMKGRGRGDINDWFYYAIVPSTGKRYRYTFNDKHDDLNIFVMDSFEADDDKEVSSNEYALPNARKVNGEVAPIL